MATPSIATSGQAIAEWTQRLTTLVVVLACLYLMSNNRTDPDLWGHVRYGQELLEYGLPETATHTYTAIGHRWINHELLSELALAATFNTFGACGILIGKCLLALALIGLLLFQARRNGTDQSVTSVLLIVVALNLMVFWNVRPQVFSFVIFAIMLGLLSAAFADWENRWHVKRPRHPMQQAPWNLVWLTPVPLLMCIWVNTHGAFVAGLAILGVYLCIRCGELWYRSRLRFWKSALALSLVMLASCAAALVNPYGFELVQWLAHSLSAARPEIIEWLPPDAAPVWWPFWGLAAATVIALWRTRRPRDLAHTVILTLTMWQAMMHRRHIPLFAILAAFWMPQHFQSVWDQCRLYLSKRGHSAGSPIASRRVVMLGLVLMCGLLSWSLVDQLRTIAVARSGYPVAAVQYMADEQISGNLVARFKWAQYTLFSLTDRQDETATRLAFDGRFRTCYPQEMVDMYFDFAAGRAFRNRAGNLPDFDPARILRHRDPHLILMDRNFAHASAVIESQAAHWVLLYQDEVSQLWGQRDRYDDPNSPHYLPPERRSVSDAPQIGVAAWPALPMKKQQDRPATRWNGLASNQDRDALDGDQP